MPESKYLRMIYEVTILASVTSDLRSAIQESLTLICETLNWPVGHDE